MMIRKQILLNTAAVILISSSQQASAFITKGSALQPRSLTFASTPFGKHRQSSTVLNGGPLQTLVETLENIPPEFDLTAGMAILGMALTPYALGILWPGFMFNQFFLDIYKPERLGSPNVRNGEIYWKLLFAVQGGIQILLIFVETLNGRSPGAALRDAYVLWAIFYIAATVKIYIERDLIEKRGFIQVWHLTVATVLILDVILRPEIKHAIQDTIKTTALL